MVEITKNIQHITIGIRFNRSFRIKDLLGAVTDELVYDDKSPLKGYFDEQRQDGKEMVLTNQQGAYLRLNTDDIIFKYICEEDFSKSIKFIKEYCEFAKKILQKYNVKKINRIGIIFAHKVNNEESEFDEIIKKLTKNHISDVQDFSISFSKKLATIDGQIKKGVKDYNNVIYSFKKLDANEIGLGLDYQRYFLPPLNNAEDLEPEKFIDESAEYLKETFYNNLIISSTKENE